MSSTSQEVEREIYRSVSELSNFTDLLFGIIAHRFEFTLQLLMELFNLLVA